MRPPWWVLALPVPFAGYLSLLLYCDLTRPEPTGFTLGITPSAIIVQTVVPGTPAAEAGL